MKPRSKGEVQPLTPPPPPPPKPKGLGSSSCSASDLLRAEADRIGGVTESKPIHADLRWAYSVAAAWLDCRNDPATIRKWREIPGQNTQSLPPADTTEKL